MRVQFIVRQTFLLLSCLILFLTVREARLLAETTPTLAQADPCASPTSSASASPSPTATPTPTPSPTPFPENAILFTEFMACPASGNEWLELFNTTQNDIQVTNWQVIDQANNKKLITGALPAQSFAVFEWTGSLLNNTGDSFKLQTSTSQVIGQASYSTCDIGVSFVYENGLWIGALESAGEETSVSENTLLEATNSAQTQLALTNTANSSTSQTLGALTENFLAHPSPTNLYRTPSKLTLAQTTPMPTQPKPNPDPPSPSPPPFLAIWSAIIGGLLQLAPITISAYDQYFRPPS
ncbi:MAG: hypothetical protein COY81_02015 [Candidatus Pacebacteria bacterium CG_4_10_14_0_8_um_filter_43_12]|nr:MAG: hypothetical protein COU66_02260 [Candidatus Pacebacteria bacterium CG10_big_fil_rev_8_21_14_0_10_44_11]PIY79523.1 MAG: hypothetical protein COY81_02015 [Candidatus Pacebacteria bacterium CG_4_10_14_0_8_um_filter_43_12]